MYRLIESQPIHEAIGGQQAETVQFLIARGADLNARHSNGRGASPLNMAKYHLGVDHPITLLLQRLGAQNIESDIGLDDDEDDEDGDDESVEESALSSR